MQVEGTNSVFGSRPSLAPVRS